jgi:vacuolar-type H+-ATPase subunit I/STV1
LLNFLLSGLSSKDPSLSILKCMIFFIVTIGMMLILDVMECMMHVVRLHWVEWMGKFYTGGGKKFRPEI